jgi:hypothetical protein
LSGLRIGVVNAIAPPAAGSRAERWAFLIRELAARGHRITLLRAELPASYPYRETLLERMLDAVDLERIVVDPGPTPARRYGRRSRGPWNTLRRALSELAWPDYWARFALRSIARLRETAASFDVVVTSGQPWSDHLVGYELTRTTGVPWIADYGDPWSITLSAGGWSPNVNERPERILLALAAGVVVTTAPTRALFVERLGVPAERLAVLPAGIEPAALPPPPAAGGLVLLQAGTVYGPRASALPLLRAVETFRGEERARLIWFGEVHRTAERAAVARVAGRCAGHESYGTVSAAEAEANVIVILGNHGGLQVPAKLWRAAGTGRWMLAITADARDALHTVDDLPGLLRVDNHDGALVSALRDLASRVVRGHVPALDRERHSWASRAAALEERIDAAMRARRRGELGVPGPMAPSAASMIRRHTWLGHRVRFRLERKLKNAGIGRREAAADAALALPARRS